MAYYADDVRNELARIFDDDEEILRAELAGLLRLGSVEVEGRRDFSNINAACVRKVVTLVKKLYPDARTEVAAVRTKKLRRTMKYFVRIFFAGSIEKFLRNLDAKEITSRTRYKIAFLRGAFLASGSVNRPEAEYRVEIFSPRESEMLFVKKIFSKLDFVTRIYLRGENFVVYMKEADLVCDFLGMIGAENAVERFEVARNLKEVRIQVNRLTNLELARLDHAIEAAQRQLADIRFLQSQNIKVRETLQEAMDIRLQFPECTIGELAKKIFIGRVALTNRFKKIHQLAEVERQKISADK